MAPYFSEKLLEQMLYERRTVLTRHLSLQMAFQSRHYKTERGKEFAFQGFGRRMGIIARAIENVFTALPPECDREDVAAGENIADAVIALHAFVINIVGCIDNLAWVWVCEKP